MSALPGTKIEVKARHQEEHVQQLDAGGDIQEQRGGQGDEEVMEWMAVGSPQYVRVLQRMISASDCTPKTAAWYGAMLETLPRTTGHFLAIGPGTGEFTKLAHARFTAKGYALERSVSMRNHVRAACPGIEFVSGFDDVPNASLDFVEYQHVAYYQTPAEIEEYVRTSLRKLVPGGTLHAMLQDETRCACAVLHNHFTGRAYGLEEVLAKVAAEEGHELRKDHIDSTIPVESPEHAYELAVFMLAYRRFSPLPTKAAVMDYVMANLHDEDHGHFTFTSNLAAFVLTKTSSAVTEESK